ncbi:hypothetical protein CBR_g30234 [Chara braunii]|uniref:VPS37 C-terminal domain-containing protein n=1 Tax=Chara braunii TaxID=69332 RepID=A0A388LCR0_CHABU|nr:hypothetical protein CBR_g30234 [Chara braunii]|eukprot:GBG79972.1 hypothetical protein CBR_g30234 [Chara braunii]
MAYRPSYSPSQSWYPPSSYPGGSNPLLRPPAGPIHDNVPSPSRGTAQRAVSYAELKERSLEELKNLMNDEEAYDAFLHSLDKVRDIDRAREELRKQSVELARKNLAREPEIAELHNQCAIIRSTELAPSQEKLDELLRREKKIRGRFSPEVLLQKLEDAKEKVDEESELLHKQMLAGEMEVTEFISKYRKLRALYHTRALTYLAAKTNPG